MIEVQILETVLGLSVTPTTVGWVLAEGHGADGTILDHHELALRAGRGVRAVNTAEQVTEEVMRVDALAARERSPAACHRSDLERRGVRPGRAAVGIVDRRRLRQRRADSVARGGRDSGAIAIAPVIGYEQTAVCILEHESSTVVMVDSPRRRDANGRQAGARRLRRAASWLTGMFERSGWRPGGVVVVGADDDINGFSWQLENALPVPVFAQTMAQVTVARGAALAAARKHRVHRRATGGRDRMNPSPRRARPAVSWSYAGAVSRVGHRYGYLRRRHHFPLGIQLAPDNGPGTSKSSGRAQPCRRPPTATGGDGATGPRPLYRPVRHPRRRRLRTRDPASPNQRSPYPCRPPCRRGVATLFAVDGISGNPSTPVF